MELTAVIKALKTLKSKKFPIKVHIDSAYVQQGITSWLPNWKRNGWVTGNKKTPVKNKELWIELDSLINQFTLIEFIKVKGHVGIEYNEVADQLANKAMDELQGKKNKMEEL